jgi:NADH-quinone oxidoreductase subunit H
VLWFCGKVFVLLFGFIWLRGTLPRLRYDQFMRLGWKVLIPFSLVWILVVAAFRELTNEGRTRLETLAYVGIPIAAIVLIWSFVTESKATKAAAARAEAAELAATTPRRTSDYPIPVLTGAPTVDLEPLSVSSTDPSTSHPEVLDG